MRIEELLRHYIKNDAKCPNEGWEFLVWQASRLVKIAMVLRGTGKKTTRNNRSKFVQDELWN